MFGPSLGAKYSLAFIPSEIHRQCDKEYIMGKKKAAAIVSKSSAKAAKRAKAVQKVERKEKKKVSKLKENDDDEQDLEGILDKVHHFVLRLIWPRPD